MKLSLSKNGDPRGRHLVLTAKPDEYAETYPVISEEVLKGKRLEMDRDRQTGEVKMHFGMGFLDRLMLAVPFAEISPGVEKMLFREEMERLIAMPVPKFEVPGMKGILWEHQAVAADLLAREEIMLDNDDMGSGKTKTILAAIIKKQWFPALVVVGNVSAKYVWERELDTWFPDVTYTVVDGTKNKRHEQLMADTDITIINVQGLRMKKQIEKETGEVKIVDISNPVLFDIDWEVLVCDEYHRLKNPAAQQTAGFLALECGRFIGASGTPIMNRPEEAWSFAHKCDPDLFPTHYGFEHQIGKHTPSGKLIGYKPEQMLAFKNWLNKNSIRRRKEHIAAILRHHGREIELPKVLHSSQTVPMTPEQRKIYDKIKKEMKLMLDDGSSKDIMFALTQILRLKQACFSPELFGGSKESGKINQIKEDVAMLVESGQKAIIFSEWSSAARILERELEQYNPAYVDGSVKGKDRQAEVDRFNTDSDCKLYIGTIGANQEAITLSAATYVLFADEAWTPMANEQAEARSAAGGMRGAGITVPVNVIRYHAEDTIEQRLSESLMKKKKVFQAMIERDGGKQIRTNMLQTIRDLL